MCMHTCMHTLCIHKNCVLRLHNAKMYMKCTHSLTRSHLYRININVHDLNKVHIDVDLLKAVTEPSWRAYIYHFPLRMYSKILYVQMGGFKQ